MNEQLPPGPGAAPERPGKLFRFLLTALLAAGLCTGLLCLKQVPLPAAAPAAGK